jgi:glycosyltransferase involved in cell wall biosynthesis
MTIAYVVPTPSLQTFVANEIIEVLKAGHAVVIIPLHSGKDAQVRHRTFDRLRSVETWPAALVDFQVLLFALRMLLKHPVRALTSLFGLHRCAGSNVWAHASLLLVTPKALATAWRLSRIKVDRIHAHFASHTATCAAIAGYVNGLPFSFTAHAYDIYHQAYRHRNDTLGWKVSNAAQVFTVSRYAASLLLDKWPSIASRVHTAYVGIPVDLFEAAPALPLNGSLRLLCVANFFEKKGLDTLIEACAIMRERAFPFRLKIRGNGPLRRKLADRISQLQLSQHVDLGESVPQEEVARLMRECHAFVMPSRADRHGDMDGIPTVFMEAMATGRPVISCAISGIPELVRDGKTGLVVPSDDPTALAEAIIRLASDDSLREKLGSQARALVEEQHDQERTTRRLLDLMSGKKLAGYSFERNLHQEKTPA